MHVVATAGHVDHGKSTLVQALTGIDPDRWAEEKRRGLTIDLGFAWTTLPSGADVAFVDVPGHERFVTNMLAGVGPVPTVLLVVAADEGWMPQTEEHVRALHALGVRRTLLVVTKSDVGDPQPVLADAQRRLGSLGHCDALAVSAVTGAGLADLVAALDRFVAQAPTPDADAAVRLWIDRSFSIDGAGTVVTGTLTAGRLRVGDRLLLLPGGSEVTVRGLESQHQPRQQLTGTARVAVNLRGVDRRLVPRGAALVTPGSWQPTAEVDVILTDSLPSRQLVTHIGAAAVATRVRPLGDRAARLHFARPLPLHLGDRLLLREPAGRSVLGADVADLRPSRLAGHGAARDRAATLAVPLTGDDLVRRHGAVTSETLRTAGLADAPVKARRVGDWWVDPAAWDGWRAALRRHVRECFDPLSAGIGAAEVTRALGVPEESIVLALVAADPELLTAGGRIRPAAAVAEIPDALQELLAALAADPLAAPDAERARQIGGAALAHGARAGLLLQLGGGIYVAPTAVSWALGRLAELPEPFSVSAARQALASSRRVVVPLLEHLDAARLTRRSPDGTRVLVAGRG